MKTKEKTGSHPLSNSKDLDPFIKRVGDARIVLLGEASHGTHEFYTWRSAITQRLIEEKGFNFIAVEGDWPDCYRVNRYVKGFDNQDKKPEQVLGEFNRWPTWMWANWEIAALVTWLKDYNQHRPANKRAGFYGLDVYSLWESLEALEQYLEKTDLMAATAVKHVLGCFEASHKNERLYAMNALSSHCRDEVVKLLKHIRVNSNHYNHDPEASLNTTQNAFVAVDAENYYRNMMSFDNETWNIRDKHMMDTLTRLLEFHGPQSKAIVWEHNTHVGDARYTNMSRSGLLNIGQMAREQYSENETVIVGFGTYQGTVMAGEDWGSPMQEMEVPAASRDSIERFLHERYADNRLLIFDPAKPDEDYDREWPHRAIGVVYNPGYEEHNYVPTHFSRRYDAFVFIDETKAVHPLNVPGNKNQVPETFPFRY
jgi:erythromycin esterase-like protein